MPFEQPETVCVNGYTYLLHDDFFSRTFALLWFFPLAEGDRRFAAKRALNANNNAFRRTWIASHPFPRHNGFKVSCTLTMHELWREGHKIVNADARVYHYSPRGWRFFFWRALVTGRDADRKFVELHAPGRVQRIVKSFTRWGDDVVAHAAARGESGAADRDAGLANSLRGDCRPGVLYARVSRPFQPGGRAGSRRA
jgi:hypothetical protein